MKPEAARRPKQTVQLEKIYSHPPGRVWQALTDPQALAQWLLPNSFQPRPGHRFRFTRRSSGGKSEKVQCQVVEVEAPRRLAYTWQAEGEEVPTLVTWTLEPVEEGTRLRLEHIGPETSCTLAGSILSAADFTFDRFGGLLQTGLSGGRKRAGISRQGVSLSDASASGRSPRPVQVGCILLRTPPGPLRCVSRRRISSLSDLSTISCLLRHKEVLP
jgi:uncharacterized protein YndB with AHSA1/START domain